MNRKIALCATAVNLAAVAGFAVSMLFRFDFGSYLSSLFIALSFVPMMSGYAFLAPKESKSAGCMAVAFAATYAAIILLVYYAQLTTVRLQELTPQAAMLLDFQQYGLMFNYDLLGYGIMSLATFFAGLTISPRTKADKGLKYLLLIHGVFFFSCLVMPMLGIFKADSPAWTGIAVLEFWCLYFSFIDLLSWRFFKTRFSQASH